MEKINKEATERIEKHIGELTVKCIHMESLIRMLEIENQELRKNVEHNQDYVV